MEKYREVRNQAQDSLRNDAARNATELAVNKRSAMLRPRDNGFIAEAKEKYLPNSIVFSAFNVFSFENKSGSTNPFLARYDESDWSFIAALIVSFVSLLFTFDAVSGEKETKTLSLALSNSVSRGTLLWGKYLSAVLSVLMIVFPGLLVSLLLILLSGSGSWSPALAGEAAAFLVLTGLLAATMAAFGLLCSVTTRNSNVSLLLALSIWLLFAVIIPNSSSFLAKNVHPIEKAEAVQARVGAALDDLSKNAPPGSWMMQSNNPSLPQHELRANLQRKRLAAQKAIQDAYSRDKFRQFERTRRMTAVSPITSFEYLIEAVVGGGYPRFRKVWDDLHIFQTQFEAYFKAVDARDPKSPHWYNPLENVSTTRLKAPFEEIPQFTEKTMTFADRVRPAVFYLLITVLTACLAYFLSFLLFVRYDVR